MDKTTVFDLYASEDIESLPLNQAKNSEDLNIIYREITKLNQKDIQDQMVQQTDCVEDYPQCNYQGSQRSKRIAARLLLRGIS